MTHYSRVQENLTKKKGSTRKVMRYEPSGGGNSVTVIGSPFPHTHPHRLLRTSDHSEEVMSIPRLECTIETKR